MKRISFLVLTAVLISCSPVSKMYISSVNTIEEESNNHSLIYSLPRTVVTLTVKATRTEFIPGPYAAYTKKYLGIEGAQEKPSVKWELSELVLNTYHETDPDFYYAVSFENDPDAFKNTINELARAGLIITPFNLPEKSPVSVLLQNPAQGILYTDLSVKRNLLEEKSTSYKRELRDSVYIQVPVEEKSFKPKSTEQKAEEAANFIIKLRKRKFKMLTGQNETSVDSGTGPASDELRRIEDEYLSLFLGKTIQYDEVKTFEYVPLANKENEQVVLFRLSDTDGFTDPFNPKGTPVILEISKSNTTKILEKLKPQDNVSLIENTIFYRMPEDVKVSVKEEEKTVLEGKASIFQQGALIGMKVE